MKQNKGKWKKIVGAKGTKNLTKNLNILKKRCLVDEVIEDGLGELNKKQKMANFMVDIWALE